MSSKPHLSQRAIVAYNRLSREVAALNYLVRVAKPSGTLGEIGRECLDRALRIANRLYRREPGLPAFGRIDTREALTAADVSLLVARLSAAGIAFEERYAHLTASGQSAQAARLSADGLPSPHA
ncbi:hypothetical protein GCM10007913_05650 [Devosia yakushimensis]|uniref:Four helix bundle protein n=1 Tax=Devosia yakushimensis TaxID=470028 RepID=A0ABQ5U9J6_9HYPH|nr:hypothetical protein [Devosia yakushimensis]GLQ08633.1 hypothetical protein GCM10007913_05650 [Devosia yakushimensis]